MILLGMHGLRAELLWAATTYGVVSVMAAGGGGRVVDWREWLEWVKGLGEGLRAAQADVHDDGDVGVEKGGDWSTDLLANMDAFASAGYEPTGDMLRDELWLEALERLSERARTIEEFRGKPLGEVTGQSFDSGVALLGAVEDSLLLMLSDDNDKRATRATPDEIYILLLAARDQGIWDLSDAG